ncbi:MAG TPA: hypothetical protein PKD48_02010 [Sphingopyxis sp.]|nr:hypothetical protein [Sphingopyxis sp.]
MTVPATWLRDIAAAGGAYWPLTIFNAEPFIRIITYVGVDYTAATFEGGIRAAFEDSSELLQPFGFATELSDGNTLVTVSIAEEDVITLRGGVDLGAIETLFHNIKCTPPGGDKLTHFAGELFLHGA